jgi:preprotein translocase subunit SecA
VIGGARLAPTVSVEKRQNPIMFGAIARKLFGTTNDRLIKSNRKVIDAVNALELEFAALDDAAVRAKTDAFRSPPRLRRDRSTTC